MNGDELQQVLAFVAAGKWWPALALALMGLTSLIRWGMADAGLSWLARRIPGEDAPQMRHLRAWIPIVLAGIAWVIAVALPIDVSTREAAYTAFLAAVAAMAGHDTVKALETVLVAIARAVGKARNPTSGSDR
jgi:hypothetical protein